MRRLRQAVAEESRCEQTSPHQGHHLRDIGWQPSKILDDSQQTFVALLAGYFVQARQEGLRLLAMLPSRLALKFGPGGLPRGYHGQDAIPVGRRSA